MVVKDLAKLSDDEMKNNIDVSMDQISTLMQDISSASFSHDKVYLAAVTQRVNRVEEAIGEIKQYIDLLGRDRG